MFSSKFLFIVIAFIMVMFVGVAMAQDSGPFDWAGLGVNLGVIGSIIAIVQLFKKYIPEKFVVFAPIALSIIAFFVVGGDQPNENVLYWAAASGYLWKIANKITPDGILSTKEELTN